MAVETYSEYLASTLQEMRDALAATTTYMELSRWADRADEELDYVRKEHRANYGRLATARRQFEREQRNVAALEAQGIHIGSLLNHYARNIRRIQTTMANEKAFRNEITAALRERRNQERALAREIAELGAREAA